MSIIEATQYELHPEGTHLGGIESVREDIKRKTMYGEKAAIAIRVENETLLGKDGKKLGATLFANRTIGRGSNLAKFIKQITGRDPGQRFDPQSLVGIKVVFVVEHHENNGQVYANIVHISRRGTSSGATAAASNGGISNTDVHGVDTTDADVQFPCA